MYKMFSLCLKFNCSGDVFSTTLPTFATFLQDSDIKTVSYSEFLLKGAYTVLNWARIYDIVNI